MVEKNVNGSGGYRRAAICFVKLSIYICSISLLDVSLLTSFCTTCTFASIAENGNANHS